MNDLTIEIFVSTLLKATMLRRYVKKPKINSVWKMIVTQLFISLKFSYTVKPRLRKK